MPDHLPELAMALEAPTKSEASSYWVDDSSAYQMLQTLRHGLHALLLTGLHRRDELRGFLFADQVTYGWGAHQHFVCSNTPLPIFAWQQLLRDYGTQYVGQQRSGQLLPDTELKHGEFCRIGQHPVGGSAALNIREGGYLDGAKCALKVVRGVEMLPETREVCSLLAL